LIGGILLMILKQPLKMILLLSFLILILTPAGMTYAQRDLLEGKEILIIFDDGLRPVAEKTAVLYPAAKAELEETIGWKIDLKPGIVLIKDNNTFQKMSGSRLVVAYALPDKGIIVIDYSRMMTDPFTLDATIKHELCHLLLHEKIGSENLPRWLDEGVAQWASGGLADIVMEKRSVLDEAFRQNRMIGLKYLSEGFPNDGNMLMLAYAESKSFIDYMAQEKGAQGILTLLNLLKDGDEIDSAIMKTFAVSFDELEKGWHYDLEKSTIWISLLINNLYEILFFLAALALVYGFFRAWRRKRQYEEDDKDGRHKTE
jgi:hypothetical protein